MLGIVQNEQPCTGDEVEKVENQGTGDRKDNPEDHGGTKGNRR